MKKPCKIKNNTAVNYYSFEIYTGILPGLLRKVVIFNVDVCLQRMASAGSIIPEGDT